MHPSQGATRMKGPVSRVAVLTADVIGSSAYSRADRRRLDSILRKAFADVEGHFPGAIYTRMAFRITAGDEFQCVISDVPRALDVVTYVRAFVATGGLRPPVRFRAAIGVGEISTQRRESPYEEDGPAFRHSRRGLELMAKGRGPVRWTRLITGVSDVDAAADAVLCLADFIEQSWTIPQWEAVRWSVLGLTRESIAKRLHVAHQNVTKRLRAAGWPHFEVAATFLRQILGLNSSTQRKVQRADAPA
jgi:SatD family protein